MHSHNQHNDVRLIDIRRSKINFDIFISLNKSKSTLKYYLSNLNTTIIDMLTALMKRLSINSTSSGHHCPC